jgi:single-strand selective monofunctional uracil DNA glycosylase
MRVPLLVQASRVFARQVETLRFAPPVHHVYNPLRYAREPQERYLVRYARGRKSVLFVGMNPGPWGMAQTGVPFGEIEAVREWLGISGHVRIPDGTHARLPVLGFACLRSEVSGRRLWALMREHYATAEEFSRNAFVANYCPLLFLDEAGRNLTPDRIGKSDQALLFPVCDRFLLHVIATLRPRWVVGVGTFAFKRIEVALVTGSAAAFAGRPRLLMVPHPSPANPRANRDWAGQVRNILVREGVWAG